MCFSEAFVLLNDCVYYGSRYITEETSEAFIIHLPCPGDADAT